MKKLPAILISTLTLQLAAAGPQLHIITNASPQSVFCGGERKIDVIFRNFGDQSFDGKIHIQIFQATSATIVLQNEFVWKSLEVLPRQTLMESAQLNFPAVRAETKFVVQWLENSNYILGASEVLVYPTNLLEELRPLAADKGVGVLDPQNELKPLLKNLQIEFEDLENFGLTNFSGKLAIIEPFRSRAQAPDDLREQIKTLAKKNTAIVWIQPPEKSGKLRPSFYSASEKQIAVVVAQPDLVSNLAENPQSQLNLIYFCKLALNPQPLDLPDLSAQP